MKEFLITGACRWDGTTLTVCRNVRAENAYLACRKLLDAYASYPLEISDCQCINEEVREAV